MDEIDSVLIYGVALLVFAISSLRFDVIYPSLGESLDSPRSSSARGP